MTVPKIEPTPPNRLVPPMTTEAMTVSSIAGAGDRFGRVQPRREHEGAEPGEEAHDDVDAAA